MATTPIANPTQMQIKSEMSSVFKPNHINLVLLITLPKVRAKTGPIIGETSMLATMDTVLLTARPMPAIVDAIMSRDR